MSTAVIARPDQSEYMSYYGKYVSLVPEGNIVETLERQLDETLALFGRISDADAGVGYAPGKWSIKEVLGHMIDGERVFAYRAMCFARNDSAPITGFEQDDYVNNASFNNYALKELVSEFEHLRRSNILFFKHLDEAATMRRGVASENEVSVRALAYILAGHELHHIDILRTRYLRPTE